MAKNRQRDDGTSREVTKSDSQEKNSLTNDTMTNELLGKMFRHNGDLV